MGLLDTQLQPAEIGDLSLLLIESAATVPTSNAPRRPGESLNSWGKRLKAGDNALAAKAKKKSRTGSTAGGDFETKHPRGRGGKWTFGHGSTGAEVNGIQHRVGASVNGKFGDQTKKLVMAFQRAHGLQVDGVVGAQTVAAMRGRKGKVAVGAMSAVDRKWLAQHDAKQ